MQQPQLNAVGRNKIIIFSRIMNARKQRYSGNRRDTFLPGGGVNRGTREIVALQQDFSDFFDGICSPLPAGEFDLQKSTSNTCR
jgi:hypothetical protein